MRHTALVALFACTLTAAPEQQPSLKPLYDFMECMVQAETKTPSATKAKVKALMMFNDLYEQGSSDIQAELASFASLLLRLQNDKRISKSKKDKRTLCLLDQTRKKLETLLASQPHIRIKPDKLTVAIYTTLHPSFGAFWKKISIIIGASVGAVGGLTLIYLLYRKMTKNQTINRALNLGEKGLALAERMEKPVTTILNNTAALTAPETGAAAQVCNELANTITQRPQLLGNLLTEVATLLEKSNQREGDGPLRQLAGILAHMHTANNGLLPSLVEESVKKMAAANQEPEAGVAGQDPSSFAQLVTILTAVHATDAAVLPKLTNTVTELLAKDDEAAAQRGTLGHMADATSSSFKAIRSLLPSFLTGRK